MPSTSITNIDRLALEGPIRIPLAIALCAVLLILFAAALWRERKILGRRTTGLFWLLRTAALGTVIWMLLAPTNVRVETSTTRKAVAVIADISASMRTIDPPGTADELRWAISTGENQDSVTAAADRALAALGVAQRHLDGATAALRQRKPESAIVEETSAANTALKRAIVHLEHVKSVTADASGELSLQASTLVGLLKSAEFESFDHLCEALEKGRTPAEKGWRESLPDLAHRLAETRSPLFELSRQAARFESTRPPHSTRTTLAAISAAPRLDRTAMFLGRLHDATLRPLAERADVRWMSFDQTVLGLPNPRDPQQSLLNLKADTTDRPAPGTDISAVFKQLNRDRQDQPVAAVILVSDMAHNQSDSRNPREIAAALAGVPVHVVPIGNPQRVRDVLLQSVVAPEVVMRNDDIVVEVHLQAYHCEGEVCTVQLLHEGEIVDFREVHIDSPFANRTVRFTRRMPAVGSERLQVAVVPLQRELTEANNFSQLDVNVTRSDIKVLLADELPRWEYRYLTQLFRRDPKVECDELLFHPRIIATGRREASKTVPMTTDDWDQYDVVVLGDLPAEHLPEVAQESLIEYLQQRGGTLVLIAGSTAMPQAYTSLPLEQILPVSPVADASGGARGTATGFAFRVTNEGQQHDALMIAETNEATRNAWDFINRFAPVHDISPWRRPHASTHTLIAAAPRGAMDQDTEITDSAFLCWQPVGRGRVIYLAGPETYRLRFLRGDRLHYRFWGQLLRWAIARNIAAGTDLVRLRTDQTRYDARDRIQATVELQDAQGEPVVADQLHVRVWSSTHERTIPLVATEIPGQYQAEIQSLPAGIFRVEPLGAAIDQLQAAGQVEPATASFTVEGELPGELVDTRCDRALAQQIADVTGGQSVPPTAVAEILKLTNLDPIVSERTDRRPLWVQWKYLWIVFGCLQCEWIIRKWKGLS